MPALSSQLNRPIVLPGVTGALVPALVGTTVFESETPFRLKSLRLAPGVLTQRVTRANGSGFLTFAYRLALTETDYDAELAMNLSFTLSGLLLSFADFRVDGPGIIPPGTFESSAHEGYTFKFNYGLSVDQPTRFCFISTNAREFSETGGKLKLITGMKSIELDVARPTVAPSTRVTPVAALAKREADAAAAAAQGENSTEAVGAGEMKE